MLKRTLHFSNPAYLSTKFEQLTIELPKKEKQPQPKPLDELGIVVLDNPQITLTHQLLAKFAENKTILITSDAQHMPSGMFIPFHGHTMHSLRCRAQIECSIPLKKQLWQQTVKAKLNNQAVVLEEQSKNSKRIRYLIDYVKSGDSSNCEAQAAAYYWGILMDGGPFDDTEYEAFVRDRFGEPPNNLLNYGYAILRAMVARALVGSGLLLVIGIHHRNQYNPFCLADDIMEPYRPFVDQLVLEIFHSENDCSELTPHLKRRLLALPTVDVRIKGQRSPLFVATQKTSASFAKCLLGDSRKIEYPEFL